MVSDTAGNLMQLLTSVYCACMCVFTWFRSLSSHLPLELDEQEALIHPEHPCPPLFYEFQADISLSGGAEGQRELTTQWNCLC